MSIEGRIDINVLFHDKDGQRLKVVSLNNSQEYTAGKVAIVSGTAGTAQTAISISGVYRDASGQLVDIQPQRISFAWDGINSRLMEVKDDSNAVTLLLRSRRGEAAVASHGGATYVVLRSSGGNTGNYTIILYEPEAD
jgi:hypothetical protein